MEIIGKKRGEEKKRVVRYHIIPKTTPKRETRPAKRRKALSVLSVSPLRANPPHFHLQNLVRNFYVTMARDSVDDDLVTKPFIWHIGMVLFVWAGDKTSGRFRVF